MRDYLRVWGEQNQRFCYPGEYLWLVGQYLQIAALSETSCEHAEHGVKDSTGDETHHLYPQETGIRYDSSRKLNNMEWLVTREVAMSPDDLF
jgi:hypothetical protein